MEWFGQFRLCYIEGLDLGTFGKKSSKRNKKKNPRLLDQEAYALPMCYIFGHVMLTFNVFIRCWSFPPSSDCSALFSDASPSAHRETKPGMILSDATNQWHYPILSNSIWYYPLLSVTIRYHLILSNTIQNYPILSITNRYYPRLSETIRDYPRPSETIRYYPILSDTFRLYLIISNGIRKKFHATIVNQQLFVALIYMTHDWFSFEMEASSLKFLIHKCLYLYCESYARVVF